MTATSKLYIIKGTFRSGRSKKPFSKTISAFSKLSAEHKAKSMLGSNYRLRRSLIRVESIEEVKRNDKKR